MDYTKPIRRKKGGNGFCIFIAIVSLLVAGASLYYAYTQTKAGESAYEIAVRNGFKGTEKEWLDSLKGATGATGNNGANGTNGSSAYEIYVSSVPSGTTPMTEAEWLASLKGVKGDNGSDGNDGAAGKSAYEIYVSSVPSGTTPLSETEWLASLKGADGKDGAAGKDGSDGTAGKSAYEIYKDSVPSGTTPMTETQWLASLKGADGNVGKSSYEIYVASLPSGTTPMTEAQWVLSLKGETGKSAYEIYKDSVPSGTTPMTEAQWLASLKGETGKSAYDIYCDSVPSGTTPMNIEDWLKSLKGDAGKDAESVFAEFDREFNKINAALSEIDVTDYVTPYDRFKQVEDIDLEQVFLDYKAYSNYFYYSLKDNQFVFVDLTNLSLNGKKVIANSTKSYKKGNNFPTKSLDLFKFVFNKEQPSSVYSNYLTKDYTPIGYINTEIFPSGQKLVGNQISVTTGLDVGAHTNKFIIKYIRNDTSATAQEVLIRNYDGFIVVDAAKDTVRFYGSSKVFVDIGFPLNYTKLFINGEEYIPEE